MSTSKKSTTERQPQLPRRRASLVALVATALLVAGGTGVSASGAFGSPAQQPSTTAEAVGSHAGHHAGLAQQSVAGGSNATRDEPVAAADAAASKAAGPALKGKDLQKAQKELRKGAKLIPATVKSEGKAPGRSAEKALLKEAKASKGLAAAKAAKPEKQAPGQALKQRRDVKPQEVLTDAAKGGLGGCLPAYGENGQCLPLIPPSMAKHAQEMRESGQDPASMEHPWSCAEVRRTFADGIRVRQAGVDPQGLDSDGDGLACGPKDVNVP